MKTQFSERAWIDYLFWQENDRAKLRRVNLLIQDIHRNAFDGMGQPEMLRHNLSGCWSRRIDQEHRLVYGVKDGVLVLYACRYHY